MKRLWWYGCVVWVLLGLCGFIPQDVYGCEPTPAHPCPSEANNTPQVKPEEPPLSAVMEDASDGEDTWGVHFSFGGGVPMLFGDWTRERAGEEALEGSFSGIFLLGAHWNYWGLDLTVFGNDIDAQGTDDYRGSSFSYGAKIYQYIPLYDRVEEGLHLWGTLHVGGAYTLLTKELEGYQGPSVSYGGGLVLLTHSRARPHAMQMRLFMDLNQEWLWLQDDAGQPLEGSALHWTFGIGLGYFGAGWF